MEFAFLTKQFYKQYSHCPEIEKKEQRPYIVVIATIDKIDFAIPLRSNINHKYVVWTDKQNKCGLDLSKTVVIDRAIHIDLNNHPYIRPNEFKNLKGKEYHIKTRLETYIKLYKKALVKSHIPANKQIYEYSTLQYFHRELNLSLE